MKWIELDYTNLPNNLVLAANFEEGTPAYRYKLLGYVYNEEDTEEVVCMYGFGIDHLNNCTHYIDINNFDLKNMKHLEDANFAHDPQKQDVRSNYYSIIIESSFNLTEMKNGLTFSKLKEVINLHLDIFDLDLKAENNKIYVIAELIEEIIESENFEDDLKEIASKRQLQLDGIIESLFN